MCRIIYTLNKVADKNTKHAKKSMTVSTTTPNRITTQTHRHPKSRSSPHSHKVINTSDNKCASISKRYIGI